MKYLYVLVHCTSFAHVRVCVYVCVCGSIFLSLYVGMYCV